MTICPFCGEEVLYSDTAYRKVCGWEKRRSQGGTNALALREPQDMWAHAACVAAASSGVDPGAQGTLGEP